MRLSAPKKMTFYVAVLLVVLGFLAQFDLFLAGYEFWLVFAGFVVLTIGNVGKGI